MLLDAVISVIGVVFVVNPIKVFVTVDIVADVADVAVPCV